jgi:hypothetical protein
MWEPRRLTTVWVFMACYRDSFTFLPVILSHAQCCVANNNGFWIAWLDLSTLLLQSLLFTINYNSSLLITALDSLHSLLDYERLLFYCVWLGSDSRVGHFYSFRCPLVNIPQLNTELSYEWLQLTPSVRLTFGSVTCPFIPLYEPNREHYLEHLVCYWVSWLSRESAYRIAI